MSFEFFLFSLFVIACGLVFLETAANPYMTELGDRETAASRLNLAQSFNGLGCICGPLVGGLLLFSGKGEANISYPYMLMGVVVLAVGFIFPVSNFRRLFMLTIWLTEKRLREVYGRINYSYSE